MFKYGGAERSDTVGLKDLAKKIKKENTEKDMTLEQKFGKAMDKYLIESRDRNRRYSTSIKPSNYFKCLRQAWYGLLGFKQIGRVDAKSVKILEVGTALHEWIQEEVFMKMAEEGIEIELLTNEEVPSFKDVDFTIVKEHNAPDMELKFRSKQYTEVYPVSAMVDGVFTFDNYTMLFEFKTINSRGFNQLFEVKKDHLQQGALYSICTGIDLILFMYLCKDTQQYKLYLHEYTKEQKEWAIERVRTLESKLINLETSR